MMITAIQVKEVNSENRGQEIVHQFHNRGDHTKSDVISPVELCFEPTLNSA